MNRNVLCLMVSLAVAFVSMAVFVPVASAQFFMLPRPVTPTEMMTGMTPEQIESLPILERPDRPGHIYGNTVRRIHRAQVQQQKMWEQQQAQLKAQKEAAEQKAKEAQKTKANVEAGANAAANAGASAGSGAAANAGASAGAGAAANAGANAGVNAVAGAGTVANAAAAQQKAAAPETETVESVMENGTK